MAEPKKRPNAFIVLLAATAAVCQIALCAASTAWRASTWKAVPSDATTPIVSLPDVHESPPQVVATLSSSKQDYVGKWTCPKNTAVTITINADGSFHYYRAYDQWPGPLTDDCWILELNGDEVVTSCRAYGRDSDGGPASFTVGRGDRETGEEFLHLEFYGDYCTQTTGSTP